MRVQETTSVLFEDQHMVGWKGFQNETMVYSIVEVMTKYYRYAPEIEPMLNSKQILT